MAITKAWAQNPQRVRAIRGRKIDLLASMLHASKSGEIDSDEKLNALSTAAEVTATRWADLYASPIEQSSKRALRAQRRDTTKALLRAESDCAYYCQQASRYGCEQEHYGAYYDGLADGASLAIEQCREEITAINRELRARAQRGGRS